MPRKKKTAPSEEATEPIAAQTASPPDVSVLMRIRDGIDGYPDGSLQRAIDSALLHQPSCTVQVIAVNNGSKDGTGDFIRNYGDDRLVIDDWAQNIGEAGALNAGAEKATGRYCIQLTARSYFEPDSLHVLVRALDDATPDVGFVFGAMRVFGAMNRNHVPRAWSRREHAQQFMANFFMWERIAFSEHGLKFEDYIEVNGAPVGICDRDFMMQMVDRLDWNGLAVPGQLVVHYERGATNHMSDIVQANRTAIDAEYKKRWGKYL